jgi:glycyl-tRNA synthetase
LAKGVGGDIIAPDSLLQEVAVPSSLFDFLSLICIVKKCNLSQNISNHMMQVANLVEAPMPILGQYDDSFLELPKDVLITVC